MAATLAPSQLDNGDGALAVRLSERLRRLRDDVMARHGSWVAGASPFERDVALWRARQGRPLLSKGQERAATLLELVKLAKLDIRPDWSLAGEHLTGHDFAFADEACLPPPDGCAVLGLTRPELEAIRACVQKHTAPPHTLHAVGETLEASPEVRSVIWGKGWIENHSVRGYAQVLAIGFEGMALRIRQRLAGLSMDAPEYARSEGFWKAALWVCDAGVKLGERYAALAAQQARAAAPAEDRQRLACMAETCRRVPARGARTLFEAVQALWLTHILSCGEDGINANSIGRLDQILAPYFDADLAAGRVTRAQAVELMEELACKLYLDYDVQAITLAGQDAEGHDATHEMSYIILEATENTGFVRDLSVRLHSGSPARLVESSARCIARGGGIPFLFNDDCFVPALAKRGIDLRDARDYAPIGCIELTIPGKANPHAVSGWLNAAKCLELALFDGMDPATGEQLGPRTGMLPDFEDYEALAAAYCHQVEHFAQRMVYLCNRGELAQREAGPLPCWSLLTEACIERGRDITDEGALYNYHSVCFLGLANTADSLCALRRLVFEEAVIAPGALLEALRADFDGFEALRQRLLNGAPKYGNDNEEADALAAGIASHFIAHMDTARSPLGGRYFVHLFSFLTNVEFGEMTGATPDGRHAGEPLAYSLSAHQGRDVRGVTAMLQSLARMPHSEAAGASAAIIDLDPKLVAGASGCQRLAQLIRAAFDLGVGQLQFNVVTAERLRKAQADPEHYGNIPVRVAGYSQMFRLLTPGLQEHVIARTKHRE